VQRAPAPLPGRAFILALAVLAGCQSPDRVGQYAFAPKSAAHDAGRPIDLARENSAACRRILSLAKRSPLIIVPGYAPLDDKESVPLHAMARYRLKEAVRAFEETGAVAILVTGGNVHPPDTPFNEAFGMKRHLVDVLKVPADRVVLEPYARHTTTNLRNAGRFMQAHGIADAIVVTDMLQSFYVGRPAVSGFEKRCREELGYSLGELVRVGPLRTRFRPSYAVMRRGDDPLDP
jgi:hypothetical protein